MKLCFDTWINQSYFWSTDNNDNFFVNENASIDLGMGEVKKLIPSKKEEQGQRKEHFTYFYTLLI